MCFDPITFSKVANVEKQLIDTNNILANLLATSEPVIFRKQITGATVSKLDAGAKVNGTTVQFNTYDQGFKTKVSRTFLLGDADQGATISKIHYDANLNCYFVIAQRATQPTYFLAKLDANFNLIGKIETLMENLYPTFTYDDTKIYLIDNNYTTDISKIRCIDKASFTQTWAVDMPNVATDVTYKDIAVNRNSNNLAIAVPNYPIKILNKTNGSVIRTSTDNAPSAICGCAVLDNGNFVIATYYGYVAGAGYFGCRWYEWTATGPTTATQWQNNNNGYIQTAYWRIKPDGSGVYVQPASGRGVVYFYFSQDRSTLNRTSVSGSFGSGTWENQLGIAIDENFTRAIVVFVDDGSPSTYYVGSYEITTPTSWTLLPANTTDSYISSYQNMFLDFSSMIGSGAASMSFQGEYIIFRGSNDPSGAAKYNFFSAPNTPLQSFAKYAYTVSTTPPADLKLWAYVDIDVSKNGGEAWFSFGEADKATNGDGEANYEDITSTLYRVQLSNRGFEKTMSAPGNSVKINNALQSTILWVNRVEVNGQTLLSSDWEFSTDDNRTVIFKNPLAAGDVVKVYYDLYYNGSSLPFTIHFKRAAKTDPSPIINSIVLAYEV